MAQHLLRNTPPPASEYPEPLHPSEAVGAHDDQIRAIIIMSEPSTPTITRRNSACRGRTRSTGPGACQATRFSTPPRKNRSNADFQAAQAKAASLSSVPYENEFFEILVPMPA